jgi:hypothetical protein
MRLSALARWVTAALLASVLCTLPDGSSWAGDKKAAAADIEAAKKHMAAGVGFMQDPDGARYEEAYAEFQKAYELSGSLNALQNLAICSQNLELDGEAIGYYEKFLEGKGSAIDSATRDQVERDLSALKAAVSWVTLTTDKAGAKITDTRFPKRGSPVNNEYKGSIQGTKVGIHPGKHKFVATLSGSKDQVWEVDIANGSELSHQFSFEKPGGPVTAEGFTDKDLGTGEEPKPDEGDEGGLPVYPFVVGGITVAAAVPWVIFMVMSSGSKSDYDDTKTKYEQGQASQTELDDAKSSLNTNNLLADVFLGVTAAAGVATIICIVVAATAGGDDTPAPAEATARSEQKTVQWSVVPSVDWRGGGGAQLEVRF